MLARRGELELLVIGIAPEVSDLCQRAVTIPSAVKLGEVLVSQLGALMAGAGSKVAQRFGSVWSGAAREAVSLRRRLYCQEPCNSREALEPWLQGLSERLPALLQTLRPASGWPAAGEAVLRWAVTAAMKFEKYGCN